AAAVGTAHKERSSVNERKVRHPAPPLAAGMSWIRREGAASASAGAPVARGHAFRVQRVAHAETRHGRLRDPRLPPPIVRRDLAIAKGWAEYSAGVRRGDKFGACSRRSSPAKRGRGTGEAGGGAAPRSRSGFRRDFRVPELSPREVSGISRRVR